MSAAEMQVARWPMVRLGDVADMWLGKMLDAKKNKGRPLPYLRNPNVRWFNIDLSDVKEMPFEAHEHDRYGLREGDVLVCEGGEAGRAAIWDGQIAEMKFQKALHRVRCGPQLYNRFLVHRLMADYFGGRLSDYYTGATIKHFTGQDLARYRFPLPPLPEQRRIAEILDKADALRAKRSAAIAQLDTLTQSIFLDIFGDPATNPKGWRRQALGTLATRFSDGPFGSNLKSEHYVDAGVRVVRLQNIGVDEFLNKDRVYISESHFSKLSKHECLPGDVLIGTLGDPNLRACIQPAYVERALNKADCVQLRPNENFAYAEYLCALLNCRSTELMAQDLVLGQTRLRISMGRLRGLEVPVPPVPLQQKFRDLVREVSWIKVGLEESGSKLNTLFESLQQRAFSGS